MLVMVTSGLCTLAERRRRGRALLTLARKGAVCLLLAICLVCPGFGAFAVQVENLYTAVVLVTDDSPGQLREGAMAGLLQVLVRVSGSTSVDQNAAVRAGLRSPESYYYQYSYAPSERTFQIGDTVVAARELRLQFEPSAVSGLLREAGLPVWGSNRPGILVWVAVDKGGERELIRESGADETRSSLSSQAARRGVPLLFPIGDLQDSAAISVAEVWGSFLDNVEHASGRYDPDAILTGRVAFLGEQLTGRFAYRLQDRWQTIDATAFGMTDLMADVVDTVVDDLAGLYAISSGRTVVTMKVEAVTRAQEYAALDGYLSKLAPVVDAYVVEIRGDVVTMRLAIEGAPQQLTELIELDEKMHLLADTDGLLHYRWLR